MLDLAGDQARMDTDCLRETKQVALGKERGLTGDERIQHRCRYAKTGGSQISNALLFWDIRASSRILPIEIRINSRSGFSVPLNYVLQLMA